MSMRAYKTAQGYAGLGVHRGAGRHWSLWLGRYVLTTEPPDGDWWDWARELDLSPAQRQFLAKAAYHGFGWAWAHLRYPQRHQEIIWPTPEYALDHPDVSPDDFQYGKTHWDRSGPGWALKWGLDLAEYLDPHHFDHWAFDHNGCGGTPAPEECAECHGIICSHKAGPGEEDASKGEPPGMGGT